MIDYWAVALTLRWTDDNMKSRPLNSWFPSAASLVLLSGRKLFWDHSLCFLRLLKKTKRCSWRKVSKWTLTPQISHMKVSLLVYLLFSVWSVVSTALICQSEQSHHEVHLVITVPELSAGSSGVDIFLFYAALRTSRLLLGSDLGFKIASKAPEQPLNGPRDEDWFVVFCVEPNYFSIDRPAGSRPGAKPQTVIVVAFCYLFSDRWLSGDVPAGK